MLEIDQIVRGRSPELSPAQREVMGFILKHPEHTVLLTANDLARKLNVSDTFIVRLAQALGFSGFSHLKRRLREYLQARIPAVDRQGETVERAQSVDGVLADVLSKDRKNLKQQVSPFQPLRSLRNRIIYRIIYLRP